MKKIIFLSMLISTMIYAEAVNVKKYIVNSGDYKITYDGEEREFITGINPGYGSALTFKGEDKDGNLEFYAVTDRGPNGDIPKYIENGKETAGKFFPVSDFTPSIGVIKVKRNKAEIVDSIPLRNSFGEKISGRVIPKGLLGTTGEIPLNFDMSRLNNDIDGLDTEGIAVDKNGNFWLCDEYGPFIVKADKHGKIIEKYGPKEGLPEILKYRVPNRGFEGITIDEKGYVYAAVQSPLDINGETKKTAGYTRIIKFNPETKESVMYAYPVDKGYKNFGAAKIGDICSVGNEKFLVIEQGKQNGKMQNLIYMIDINEADEIENNGDLEYGKLKKLNPAKKELVLDLRKYGWDIEKAEGLTILPDGKTIAVVNDNDFGIATKIEDPDHIDSEMEDYIYDGNKKEFTYKGKTAPKAKVIMTQNSKSERESKIWLFEMDKKIK